MDKKTETRERPKHLDELAECGDVRDAVADELAEHDEFALTQLQAHGQSKQEHTNRGKVQYRKQQDKLSAAQLTDGKNKYGTHSGKKHSVTGIVILLSPVVSVSSRPLSFFANSKLTFTTG